MREIRRGFRLDLTQVSTQIWWLNKIRQVYKISIYDLSAARHTAPHTVQKILDGDGTVAVESYDKVRYALLDFARAYEQESKKISKEIDKW